MESASPKYVSGDSTFVFVHGAWGCGALWNQTEYYLQRLGHRTLALDLPAHGVNFGDITAQTTDTYADYVSSVIGQLGDRVILVGHSMGGSVITAVAEKIPQRVEKLVYCGAFLLQAGESGNGIDGSGIQPVDWREFSHNGKEVTWKEYLRQNETSDSSRRMESMEDARFERVYAGNATESIAALQGKVYPTEERWGSVPRYYVRTTRDEAITPDLQERMLANLPCRQVYAVDTDHFLMMAAPLELAVILNDVANQSEKER